MNATYSAPQQDTNSQSRGAERYRLKTPGIDYDTPYIEHWVLQLHGVPPERIDDPDVLNATLHQALTDLDLTRVSTHSHFFGPGVSTVIILSESHLSAHTWPEMGYLHLDIVTCVEKLTGDGLRAVFETAFSPNRVHVAQLEY